MRTWSSIVVVTALLAWPRIAGACAVCFSATDENRSAFLLTTVFLSFLPLATIGGLVFWVARRARALEAPVAEAPVAEAPVAEAPVAEASMIDAPIASQPTTWPQPSTEPVQAG